jgi:hypothetical protein
MMRAHQEEHEPPVSEEIPGVTELPPVHRVVVAAVVKTAFGLAIGTVGALWLGGLAAISAMSSTEQGPVTFTWLLGTHFLPGYEPTWSGVFVGLVWGFACGFVLGFLAALARNRMIKFFFWFLAKRERLAASRTVLDDLM